MLLPSFLAMGAGWAITLAPMSTAVMGSAGASQAGVASAVANTSREVGGVLGVAALGALRRGGGLCGRELAGYVSQERRADRLLHAAGEQPPPNLARVNTGQVGHPVRQPGRVGSEPVLAVEHVLQ